MSTHRTFASLSASLLARKGGARPAMRPALAGQNAGRNPDPLNDLGWDDMGEPASAAPAAPRGDEAVVVFAPAQPAAPAAEPLLARKPPAAEVVRFVREPAPAAAAPLTALVAPQGLRRTRPAAFTLRLDPDRHYRLREACARQARSGQAIVIEALDRFLAALPELEPLGAQVAAQRIA